MSELQDDTTLFNHKISFELSMSGAQHMTAQVLTGDERLAIERVVDAARRVANLDIGKAARAVSMYVHGYLLPSDGMRLLEKQLRVGVDAALGITTEDE